MFTVFRRNWYQYDSKGRVVPDSSASKYFITECETESEARKICKEYNENNEPGELSHKAEYMEN